MIPKITEKMIEPEAALAKLHPEYGDLRRQVMEALHEDPEIRNPSDIGANLKPRLFSKKMNIELFGKVTSKTEKARAYDIVKHIGKDKLKIVNHLKIVEKVGEVKNKTPDDEG